MSRALAGLLKRLREGVPRRLLRARKHIWQRRHLDRNAIKTPVWVVGCHRSGTSMMIRTITRCPMARVYDENSHASSLDYRLRSDSVLARLIRKSYAPVVVFKPICDAHLTDRLLERHPNSRALWPFRRYEDVANSAVRKWKGHQKDIMKWIRDRDWSQLGWRGERLSPALIDLITRLYREDMTHEEGAALQWYLRNTFYFDLGLDQDHRVRLVRYEDLVSKPLESFERVFAFMGCPFDPRYVDDVFATSIKKAPFPSIDPEIRSLCDGMAARLEEANSAQDAAKL